MKKMMNVLKIILGTLLGLIVFLLVRELTVYLVSLMGKIPYVDTVLYWPSAFPIVANLLPPLVAIHVAAFTAEAVGDNAKPLGILLVAYYVWEIISVIIAGAISWQGMLSAVLGIAISLICLR